MKAKLIIGFIIMMIFTGCSLNETQPEVIEKPDDQVENYESNPPITNAFTGSPVMIGNQNLGLQEKCAVWIEAEAYTDKTVQVEISQRSDASGGAIINKWDKDGDILIWDVEIPEDGIYDFVFSYASGRDRHIELEASAIINEQSAEFVYYGTGGWGNSSFDYRNVRIKNEFNLKKGNIQIKMVRLFDNTNLDWIGLIPVSANTDDYLEPITYIQQPKSVKEIITTDELLVNSGFEDDRNGWYPADSNMITNAEFYYSGNNSIRVFKRGSEWAGVRQDITQILEENGPGVYLLESSAMLSSGRGFAQTVIRIEDETGMKYFETEHYKIKAKHWKRGGSETLKEVNWTGAIKRAEFYIQTIFNDDLSAELYVDDMSMKKVIE